MPSDAFIPLAAALKQANPDAGASRGSAFTALTSAPSEAEAPATQPCAAPKLELERDGARIKCIRVTCRCGEVIELACDY